MVNHPNRNAHKVTYGTLVTLVSRMEDGEARRAAHDLQYSLGLDEQKLYANSRIERRLRAETPVSGS